MNAIAKLNNEYAGGGEVGIIEETSDWSSCPFFDLSSFLDFFYLSFGYLSFGSLSFLDAFEGDFSLLLSLETDFSDF